MTKGSVGEQGETQIDVKVFRPVITRAGEQELKWPKWPEQAKAFAGASRFSFCHQTRSIAVHVPYRSPVGIPTWL